MVASPFFCPSLLRAWQIVARKRARQRRGARLPRGAMRFRGQAVYKWRLARSLGKLCLLPAGNVRRLKALYPDFSGCVGLPANLKTCLEIWDAYVR